MSQGSAGSAAVSVMGLVGALVLPAVLTLMSDGHLPLPIYPLFLIFMIASSKPLIGACLALCLLLYIYFIWLRPASHGRGHYTMRTWSCFAAVMSLSVWWYVVGWSYGLRYQGQSYTL